MGSRQTGDPLAKGVEPFMMYYIGIDLGASAMKLLLMDAQGTIHNTVTKEYPLEFL